jgi:hypothetical protein
LTKNKNSKPTFAVVIVSTGKREKKGEPLLVAFHRQEAMVEY